MSMCRIYRHSEIKKENTDIGVEKIFRFGVRKIFLTLSLIIYFLEGT